MNDIARMEVMKALRDFKKLEYGVGDKKTNREEPKPVDPHSPDHDL